MSAKSSGHHACRWRGRRRRAGGLEACGPCRAPPGPRTQRSRARRARAPPHLVSGWVTSTSQTWGRGTGTARGLRWRTRVCPRARANGARPQRDVPEPRRPRPEVPGWVSRHLREPTPQISATMRYDGTGDGAARASPPRAADAPPTRAPKAARKVASDSGVPGCVTSNSEMLIAARRERASARHRPPTPPRRTRVGRTAQHTRPPAH